MLSVFVLQKILVINAGVTDVKKRTPQHEGRVLGATACRWVYATK